MQSGEDHLKDEKHPKDAASLMEKKTKYKYTRERAEALWVGNNPQKSNKIYRSTDSA